jgi:uncharacterized protein (TIGR02284 family)
MTSKNEDGISTLNNLIETCRDGEQGFRTAAEGVDNGQLRSMFLEYAMQRGEFCRELEREVRRLGGDPERTGTVAGAAHRGWMNIKSAVTGKDEDAIIAECERGEDSAVGSYREALNEALPPDTRILIERQYREVQAAHDRIRALERRAEGSERIRKSGA